MHMNHLKKDFNYYLNLNIIYAFFHYLWFVKVDKKWRKKEYLNLLKIRKMLKDYEKNELEKTSIWS